MVVTVVVIIDTKIKGTMKAISPKMIRKITVPAGVGCPKKYLQYTVKGPKNTRYHVRSHPSPKNPILNVAPAAGPQVFLIVSDDLVIAGITDRFSEAIMGITKKVNTFHPS